MAEGVSASMSIVLRMVGDAIGLDSQNRRKEAYCMYLSCCIYISQILKDDAWDKDLKTVYNKDVAKLYKLLQQCQERAHNIISSESLSPLDSPPGSPRVPYTQSSQTLSPHPANVRKHSDPLPSRPGQGHKISSSETPGSPSTPPQYRGKPLKLPSPPSSPHIGRSPGQNTNNLYKPPTDRRITGLTLRISRHDNVNKNLSTMRKMAENYVIAKAREEAIRKKVWERQQRLQIEANRRFASAVAASKEEQEQRLLYTRILEYEQDMVWPKQLREKLKHSPEDTALINNIINQIFSSKDHPLRQFLLQYQYHVYKKLLPLLKDVNFPNEKQPINTSTGEHSQTVSKLDIEQVDGGSTEQSGSKNTENRDEPLKESSDEMKSKKIGECDNLEESEGSNGESLTPESGNIEKDDVIDNDTPEDNLSTHCDDTKDILKNNSQEDEEEEDDLSNLDDDICKNKSLKTPNKPQGDTEVDYGESKDNDNSGESCSQTQMIDSDKSAVSDSENISFVVREILEDMITQIAGDKCSGASDKEDDVASDGSDLELKSVDDDSCVDNTDSNVDLANRTCVNKSTNLVKIESFDLESEFLNLEDDMFDSEGSEDEAEDDVEQNSKEHSDEGLNQGIGGTPSTEKESSKEMPSNEEDTKQSIALENDKTEQGRADEGEKEAHSDPKKDIPEGTGLGGGGHDSTTHSIDKNKDTPPTVDLDTVRKQLNEIFVDMRFFLEKLKGFIILAYEELATPTGHDQCYAAVEYPFFHPLWPLLLGVLRRVNFEKEISLGSVMTKNIHSTPADMGVVGRLCLSDKESLEATGNKYPYQLAIEQLQKVTACCCPLEKLECIVRASRGICQCVEDYWECKGKPRHCPETSIGCDDLLPIFSYVIVKSGMGQLVSETSVMEEFIPEGYLMGEEGYCLTTLQTALAYLVTMDDEQKDDVRSGQV